MMLLRVYGLLAERECRSNSSVGERQQLLGSRQRKKKNERMKRRLRARLVRIEP